MTHNNHDDTSPIERARAEVQQAIDEAPERSRHVAATEGRRWYRRSVLAAAGVAVLVSLCLSSLALAISGQTDARVDEQDVKVATLLQIAEDAKTQGDLANRTLEERGQAPVPIPDPSTAGSEEVLVAAATARVLASLPDARPTAAQLGEAVARFIAANPITPAGPTPRQISEGLAGYLTVNPPPSGPPGRPGRDCDPVAIPECKGPRGDPPTSQEIQAEFAKWVQANPNALCPRGGEWGQLQVRLVDGGWADVWDCVVRVVPPSSSSPTPSPTATTAPALVPVPTN